MKPEQPLALATRRLADGVAALADPTPVWVGGACQWVEPLYVRLRGALKGSVTTRRGVAGSRLPCRTDILTLVIDLDLTLAEWQPRGEGAVDRLHRLRDRSFAPEDTELLEGYHRQLERWAVTAAELLGDNTPTVALRLPCPSCGARHVLRRNQAGEAVRVWVLQVSEHGCRCLRCEASWLPDQFRFLAALLGLPELPAA